MNHLIAIIIFLIGLFFFCDTIIPDRMKSHLRFWYWYIPGYQTFQLIIKKLRGVKYIPKELYTGPLEVNFKLTRRELRYYMFDHLYQYYKMTGKEKIESPSDIKILYYGTSRGGNTFNIQFKAKLDGKWSFRGLGTDEEKVKEFQKWIKEKEVKYGL
jgi:hypothetical protein